LFASKSNYTAEDIAVGRVVERAQDDIVRRDGVGAQALRYANQGLAAVSS